LKATLPLQKEVYAAFFGYKVRMNTAYDGCCFVYGNILPVHPVRIVFMAPSTTDVYLYVPNLIGYMRAILTIAFIHFSLTDWKIAITVNSSLLNAKHI
jgi:hypothetical protein